MALMHVNFYSEELGMCMQADVIIPQPQQGIGVEGGDAKPPYKTLYLLHGMSDDNTIWQRRTSIERYVAPYGLAVVMPAVHLSFYTDMAWGGKFFTYVSEELPRVMEGFFPLSAKREDRFAAGLSMGGYGAMKLGLRCPDTFAAVASLSGALDVGEMVAQSGDRQPELNKTWEAIWGAGDQFKGSDEDLLALAEKLAKRKGTSQPIPKLFAWCGTEDFLFEQNHSFRDHAAKLGLELAYSESPGDHSWGYWDEQIQQVLKWLPLK